MKIFCSMQQLASLQQKAAQLVALQLAALALAL